MIEIALFNRLEPLAGGRVFPGLAPKDTPTPYLTYTHAGGADDFALGGATGAASASLQVDAWAADHFAALTLAEAVKAALLEAGDDLAISGAERLPDEIDPETGRYAVRREFFFDL